MSLPRNVGSRLRDLGSIYEIIRIFRDKNKFRDLGIVFYGKVDLTEAWRITYQMVFMEDSF